MPEPFTLVECPRDAWQGLPDIIPAQEKANYLKALVLAGFQHIDAVSFVSPKHVKQMADSEEVMSRLRDSLPDTSRVIVEIVPRDGGCELTLTHVMSADWAAFVDKAAGSWRKMIEALAGALTETNLSTLNPQ